MNRIDEWTRKERCLLNWGFQSEMVASNEWTESKEWKQDWMSNEVWFECWVMTWSEGYCEERNELKDVGIVMNSMYSIWRIKEIFVCLRISW